MIEQPMMWRDLRGQGLRVIRLVVVFALLMGWL